LKSEESTSVERSKASATSIAWSNPCQFSSLVKDIHAIDISSKMIAISKEKAALGHIENVNFEQSDIFDKKYSSESYDVILAF